MHRLKETKETRENNNIVIHSTFDSTTKKEKNQSHHERIERETALNYKIGLNKKNEKKIT